MYAYTGSSYCCTSTATYVIIIQKRYVFVSTHSTNPFLIAPLAGTQQYCGAAYTYASMYVYLHTRILCVCIHSPFKYECSSHLWYKKGIWATCMAIANSRTMVLQIGGQREPARTINYRNAMASYIHHYYVHAHRKCHGVRWDFTRWLEVPFGQSDQTSVTN